MKTYSEKLKDPRWQRKRLEVMQRDNFACCQCGDAESTLNVHHLKYHKSGDPWMTDDENLVTLCENCHTDVEWIKSEFQRMMGFVGGRAFLSNLFNFCEQNRGKTVNFFTDETGLKISFLKGAAT